MEKSIYGVVVVLILSASSCSKEKKPGYDSTGALAAVVKSVTHSNTGTTVNYVYDTNGRIQLIQSSNGVKTTFEYADSLLTQTELDKTGNIVSVAFLTLDSRGLVSNSVVKDANGAVVSNHTYVFDDQKQLTAVYNYTPNNDVNGKTEWIWGSGNMYNYSIYDSAITHKAFDSYLWYYEPAITSVGNANTGRKFLGADSKYLIRKTIGYTWGAANVVSTFDYAFDSQHRVIETKTYDHNGLLKNTDSYTYY